MQKDLEILKKNPLFVGISDNELSGMLSCLSAQKKTYAKDSYVWISGNPATSVGIVLSGSVHIIKEDFWGNRAIYAKIGAGEMFGEAFSCTETMRLPISVLAVENASILFIDYKRIVTTCSSACTFHSRLIQNMLKILAWKNVMLTQKIDHLVKRSTRDKLLSYLSAEAEKNGSTSFDIPFNRQELADYLSVDRSAMSNELCKLRDNGTLQFERNHFKLNSCIAEENGRD